MTTEQPRERTPQERLAANVNVTGTQPRGGRLVIPAVVVMKDLNGDHFLGLQEGETYVRDEANLYIVWQEMPNAANPQEKVELPEEDANRFLYWNVRFLLSLKAENAARFNMVQACAIAFHRLLAIKDGLVSRNFKHENFFVDYSEVRVRTEEDIVNLPNIDTDAYIATMTKALQDDITENFADRVSLVAFVFRARGHHYTAELDDLYVRVWGKCRYPNNKMHISYQHLATHALHAIFPTILDEYWRLQRDASHVNGALAKRYDVAPAGNAGPYVLKQGLDDLQMVAPGLKDRLKEQTDLLDDILRRLGEHRFVGSVNARYYGVKKLTVPENKLSAVAATIKAALDGLAPEAPLGKSNALDRIARNAPITGAVLGRAIRGIADRPEVVNTLLITEKGE